MESDLWSFPSSRCGFNCGNVMARPGSGERGCPACILPAPCPYLPAPHPHPSSLCQRPIRPRLRPACTPPRSPARTPHLHPVQPCLHLASAPPAPTNPSCTLHGACTLLNSACTASAPTRTPCPAGQAVPSLPACWHPGLCSHRQWLRCCQSIPTEPNRSSPGLGTVLGTGG